MRANVNRSEVFIGNAVNMTYNVNTLTSDTRIPLLEKRLSLSVLSLTENTLKLSLPFGQVKLSSIVKFTNRKRDNISATICYLFLLLFYVKAENTPQMISTTTICGRLPRRNGKRLLPIPRLTIIFVPFSENKPASYFGNSPCPGAISPPMKGSRH